MLVNQKEAYCVVGSGPAGVAGALALLEQGKSVIMLDIGKELPKEAVDLKNKRIAQPLSYRNESAIPPRLGDVPLKLKFGSAFAYQDFNLQQTNAAVAGSFAEGGLSHVWGAAILPYSKKDLKGWPISLEALEPAYRSVLNKLIYLRGTHDDLEADYPLYVETSPLNISKQASLILNHFKKNKESWNAAGLKFGVSRLAFNRHWRKGECTYCAGCFYGCHDEQIYHASASLDCLRSFPGFHYVKGIEVEKFSEQLDYVEVHAVALETGQKIVYQAAKLFLAAGGLGTSRIVFASMPDLKEVKFLDSQYFIMPLILPKRLSPQAEALHTLSQIFLELDNKDIDSDSIHMQLYTYNHAFVTELGQKLRYVPLGPAFAKLLSRYLIVLQGFLHSDDSAQIVLSREGKLSSIKNPKSIETVEKLKKWISQHRKILGMYPLTPLLEMGLPGRSFHIGGSFPMKEKPGFAQTDILGRLYGMRRVHLVDASVFPTIPAATITLTVMANAYRIGSYA